MTCSLYPNNTHDATLCPGCQKEPENKTREDAYVRVVNARLGYLEGEPTLDYLVALRGQVYSWLEEIQREIHKSVKCGRDEEEE